MEISAQSFVNPYPFLEIHYYKSGLRTDFISANGLRPDWAPPADWVEFRDEIPLKSDDLIVEVAKFSVTGQIISWIGVYKRSKDQVLGDRHYHAGIGVWLPNFYPSDPVLLVQGLESLLKIFQTSNNSDFEAKALAFIADYLSGYLSTYVDLPQPLNGLRATNTQPLDTAGFIIDRTAETADKALEDLIFRLFFLGLGHLEEKRRAIILLSDKESIKSISSKDFLIHNRTRFTSEFLTHVPSAFDSVIQQNSDLREKLAEEKATTDNLDHQVDQLRAELNASQSLVTDLERQCNELRNSLEGNDEHRRHAVILQELAETHSRLPTITSLISSLRHDIPSEISSNFRNLISSSPREKLTSNSDTGTHSLRKNIINDNQIKSRKEYSKIVFLSIILITLIIIAAILIYRFV